MEEALTPFKRGQEAFDRVILPLDTGRCPGCDEPQAESLRDIFISAKEAMYGLVWV